MEIIVECFPFAFGILLGLTWNRFGGPRKWRAPWGAASVALGAFATLASGEWRVSPLYFLFDVGLVAAVSLGVVLLLKHWQQRRAVR